MCYSNGILTHLTFILFILNIQTSLRYAFLNTDTIELNDSSSERLASNIPKIVTPNIIINAKRSETVALPCQVIDKGELAILWSKGLEPLYYDKKPIIPFARSQIDGTSLILYNITDSDAGNYTCRVVTDKPIIQVIHTLVVLVPPTVDIDPVNGHLEVNENDSIRLRCKAQGIPKPTITWQKENGNVARATINDTVLSISKASKEDTGVYKCLADNSVDAGVVKTFNITVLYAPVITLDERVFYTNLKEEVKLYCKVDAYPRAHYEWVKVKSREKLRLHGHIDNLHAKVYVRDESDFGDYVCTATNSLGTSSKYVEITGRPMIPIISNPADDFITPEKSFELKYRVVSKAPLTKVFIAMRHSINNLEFSDWNTTEIKIEGQLETQVYDLKHKLSNLNKENTYEVIIYAENKYGRSEGSDLYSITLVQHHSSGKSSALFTNNTFSVPIILFTLFILAIKKFYNFECNFQI